MPDRVMVSLRATPGVSWKVLWRCPLCSAYHSIETGAMWEHLRLVHGWDRERYDERLPFQRREQ